VVLVNPARPTIENRDALARAEKDRNKLLDDLTRGDLPDPDEPEPPGRS